MLKSIKETSNSDVIKRSERIAILIAIHVRRIHVETGAMLIIIIDSLYNTHYYSNISTCVDYKCVSTTPRSVIFVYTDVIS